MRAISFNTHDENLAADTIDNPVLAARAIIALQHRPADVTAGVLARR